MKTGKALIGILTGVAAGAAVGMLFAPHKGRKTRNKISRKSKELADAINDNIDLKINDFLKSISRAVNPSGETSRPSQQSTANSGK